MTVEAGTTVDQSACPDLGGIGRMVIVESFECTKRGVSLSALPRLGAENIATFLRWSPSDVMFSSGPIQVRPLTLAESIVLLLVLWALWTMGASAQVIPIKTAPVATGSQFQLHPSHARGMGGVHLAVDDTLGDAFVNPATAARLDGTWAYSAPTHYTITGRDGGARTLSMGVLVDRGPWFGGIAGALQQLSSGASRSPRVGFPCPRCFTTTVRSSSITVRPLPEQSAQNQYVTLLAGREVSDQWALAAKVHWAGLQAMEGVDLMYPGNLGLRQDGYRFDARVGLLREWNDRSLRILLLHNRVDMQHDVREAFVALPTYDRPVLDTRWNRHYDRTNTWGLHLAYDRPLRAGGWRLGTVLTANRKGHPKIPNYDLMNIPRDPGTSWASRLGIGVSHADEHTTIGADLLVAPMVSETWANAQMRIERPEGGVIQAGERTVVNDFIFANTTLRTGLRHRRDWWELQAGVEVHTIRYWLTQRDRVERTTRDQYEDWSEWTLTWGGSLDWGLVTLRYTGDLTLGTGRPGVRAPGFNLRGAEFAVASDVVVAPRGALGVQERRVFTHQVSLTVPIPGTGE